MDYSKGKIYKIVCNTTGLVYIGSTITTLNRRLSGHKSNYNCGVKYITSKLVLENNNFEIILLENYPCDNRKQLELREGWYIRNNDCVNNYIAGRTKQEYNKQYEIDNKERIKLRKKQYFIENKEKIKKYLDDNKEKIKERKKQYRIDNREYFKQYEIDNKERIKQRTKKYRDYQNSWGGRLDIYNNTLLRISTDLFTTS